MSESMIDELVRQWNRQEDNELGRQIDVDAQTASAAYGASLGTVLRSLERKASTPEGADQIWRTIEREAANRRIPTSAEETPQPLDPDTTDSILKDILGGKAREVEDRMGKTVRLDGGKMKKVLAVLLPVVLGALKSQASREPSGGGGGAQSLPEILGRARKDLDKHQPKSGGILDAILDRDQDGDVDLSDLAGIFLGGKR